MIGVLATHVDVFVMVLVWTPVGVDVPFARCEPKTQKVLKFGTPWQGAKEPAPSS